MDLNDIMLILSTVTTIASILLVIFTLTQNHKMLIEATRPYIAIYLDSITICEQDSFFVIKNFGHSTAHITDFKYDDCLKNTRQKYPILNEQFDFIQGITLAPGQSKLLQFDVTKISSKKLIFAIKYKSSHKCYKEEFVLDTQNYIHIPETRPSSHIEENWERLVHSLREIIERLI